MSRLDRDRLSRDEKRDQSIHDVPNLLKPTIKPSPKPARRFESTSGSDLALQPILPIPSSDEDEKKLSPQDLERLRNQQERLKKLVKDITS